MLLKDKRLVLLASLGWLVMFSSCAIVTVNINFPAQEVRKAYESLEEEMLQTPQGEKGKEDGGGSRTPEPGSRYIEEPPQGETLSLRKLVFLGFPFKFGITASAWAQEELAERIAAELKGMPEVTRAYGRRAQRLANINNLLSAGKVGEGNDGLLAERAPLTQGERSLVEDENSDRRTIIDGMTRAIIKLDNMPLSDENIKQVYPQAAAQFAATRRTRAQAGWWVQLPTGRWVRH
jgi:uncharacterized protein YdbL (DUF1318 family)